LLLDPFDLDVGSYVMLHEGFHNLLKVRG